MSTTTTLRTLFPSGCDDAIAAHGDQDIETAWATCERPDWMLWACERMAGKPGWPDQMALVRMYCAFARRTLHLVPADKDSSRLAIEAAERWVADPSAENKAAAWAAGDAASAARDAASAAERNAQADIIRTIWPMVTAEVTP